MPTEKGGDPRAPSLAGEFAGLPFALRLFVLFAALRFLTGPVYQSLFSPGIDFRLVWEAAGKLALQKGASLYDAFLAFRPGGDSLMYMYPAPVAMLYWPLGMLGYSTAWTLFQLLSLGSVFLAWGLWERWRPGGGPEARFLSAALTLLFFPLGYALLLGQSEPLALAALIAGLWMIETKREAAGALLIALCILAKLFLGLLLLHFLLARRTKPLALTLAWLAAISLLSLACVPASVQAAFWHKALSPIGIEAYYDNHSITGLVYRELTVSRYNRGWTDAPGAARLLSSLLSLLALGAFARSARAFNAGGREDRALALCLATCLLLAPHLDTHHFTFLLVPFWLSLREGSFRGLTAVLAAFFAFYQPLNSYPLVDLNRVAWWFQGLRGLVVTLPFFALLGLWLKLLRTQAP